jgi:glycosyltransferase involved in cell wall biosynthesis
MAVGPQRNRAVQAFFRDVYRVEVPIVPYSIDPASYAPAPKERAILVMPRKMPALAAFVHNTFKRRHPRCADIPWWVIDGVTMAEAAAAMAHAQWFVSLSQRESFGLPPLEAMACGTIPVGFRGDGGREYMVAANGIWVEDEDWLGCVDALARAIDMVDSDPQAHAAMLSAGRLTAQHYSPAAACVALREFWCDELSRPF